MLPPDRLSFQGATRKPVLTDQKIGSLVAYEAFLRKTAYRNTPIQTEEAFFDDSDLPSAYFLVVVYDKISQTPLLSSRYYFDKTVIAKSLQGESQEGSDYPAYSELVNPDHYATDKLFLADRFSGNIHHPIYRKHRSDIHAAFYTEIQKNNEDCTLILMARKEKHDKLLKKYLSLGFRIVGTIVHKTRVHWVVIADLKNA